MVGGLISSTLLTLIVVPALLSYIGSIIRRFTHLLLSRKKQEQKIERHHRSKPVVGLALRFFRCPGASSFPSGENQPKAISARYRERALQPRRGAPILRGVRRFP